MTLWVLVLLAVVGASFAVSMRAGLASARNFREDTQSYYQAIAGYEDAVQFLLDDKDDTVDYTDTEGRLITANMGDPFVEERETDFGKVTVRILDESARLSLNSAPRDSFVTILARSGVDDKGADEIADSIADWRDPDDEHRLNGAESDYYEPLGYEAKNGPFNSVEELLLVKGMDKDILYGNAERELTGIRDFFTICPAGGMNVNTVSQEMMDLLGVPYSSIQSIMLQRASGPVLSIPDHARRVGINNTSSNCFRIVATAEPAGTTYARTIEAVVMRVNRGGQKKDITVLEWRDDVPR